MKTLHIADLFCGAGGTSTGAIEAIEVLGYRPALTAINHWPVAIATHTRNHPDARHLCTAIDDVNPRTLFRGGELNLLWASPECTHHSTARGGKPVNEQSRATAWCVPRWIEAVRPEIVLIENVPEFKKWGPRKDGSTFAAWFAACCSMGYRGEVREFVAADYGDPTTRKRLFVQFVRGRRRVVWPDPTHCDPASPVPGRELWIPARDIIDWQIPGQSIYERERPLSDKTLDRIFAGLRKFGLKPFIVPKSTGAARTRPVDTPLHTVTCTSRGEGLAEPFLIHAAHAGQRRARGVDEPLPTVAGNRGDMALCQPALLPQQGGGVLRPVSEPAPTVSTDGAIALVEPFLVTYYGTGGARCVADPLDTVTTRDRFGLCRPVVIVDGERYLLDVRFRMLQPHELAAAQGFRRDYKFSGNKSEQVKQIGNAVPRGLARALVLAALSQRSDVRALTRELAAA